MASLSSFPTKVDLVLHWGDNLRAVYQVFEADDEPYSGLETGEIKFQARVHPLAKDVVFEGSTEDDPIAPTIGVSGNEIALDIPTTDANPMYAYVGLYYDIQYKDITGAITTLFQGKINTNPQVTV